MNWWTAADWVRRCNSAASCDETKLIAWLDPVRADAVFGWRQIKKHKVTSAAAVLSLGLAIGACTAAFHLMLDYSVFHRHREIDIRMAIGAEAGRIVQLVTAEIFLMVFAGALAGGALGMASVRYRNAALSSETCRVGRARASVSHHPRSGIPGLSSSGDPCRTNRSGYCSSRGVGSPLGTVSRVRFNETIDQLRKCALPILLSTQLT